jgi:sirohydrochlorin cobaltochelatase
MERRSILILGHGSRRPGANAEFEALVARFRARSLGRAVGHAYIELAEPLLADNLAAAAGATERVTVLPLFLFAAGHVKEDVGAAIADAKRRFPAVRFEASPALGVDPALVATALDRADAAVPLRSDDAARTVLLAVGRGSSDPDANGDFCKLVRLLSEGGGFARSEPCFIGITGPRFEEASARLALSRPERVLVLPYFVFEGLLVERLRKMVARFAAEHREIDVRLAAHLGPDDRILDVLEARLAGMDPPEQGKAA